MMEWEPGFVVHSSNPCAENRLKQKEKNMAFEKLKELSTSKFDATHDEAEALGEGVFAEAMKQHQEELSKEAVKEVVQVLKQVSESKRVIRNEVRFLNRQLRNQKRRLKELDMATKFAQEEEQFLPLLQLLGFASAFVEDATKAEKLFEEFKKKQVK